MPAYTASVQSASRYMSRQLTVWMIVMVAIMFIGFRLFLGMTWFGLVFLILVGLGSRLALRRTMARQVRSLASIVIIIENDTITRRHSNYPERSIQRGEIAGIREWVGYGLAVRSRNRANDIMVPSLVDRYDELREQLLSWHPFKKTRLSLLLVSAVSATVVVALMGIFLSSGSSATVLATGIVLAIMMVVSAVVVERQTQIDRRTKAILWANIPIVLALIAARIYFALR